VSKDPAKRSNDACVLVSGGVESAVLVNDALSRYDRVIPVYVRNYLRWEDTEIFALKNFLRCLKQNNLKPLAILEMTMRDTYENHWSITGIRIPSGKTSDDSVYLPGRDIVLLSKAAIFASVKGIPTVEIGVLKGNPFPDSTKQFFKKLSDVLSMGLNQTVEIKAPFQKLKKEDVIAMGQKLPLEFTFSCLNPKGYEHCGECNKCVERKKAFFAAGVFDKTRYKKPGI
jgi:7-cyano-7-deazaguanine synthase